MSRTAVEYRSASNDCYKSFCKKHPNIKLTREEWRAIIYGFNEIYKEYILETGFRVKLPSGLGDFTVTKKMRKRVKGKNGEFINLPVDWKKTREKGKVIYNMNYHTNGYFFGWTWVKTSTRLRYAELFYFRPCRVTSRLLNHYITIDDKYQNMYETRATMAIKTI
jgi:hypothetical protein